MTAVLFQPPTVVSVTPQASLLSSRSAFVELPLELRQAIYGYVLDSDCSSPGETKIELSEEAKFTGSDIDICLRLHWYWFLTNRQIVREGVQYGFRWSKVRFVGGPWVIWNVLQRIQTPGPRTNTGHDDDAWEEKDYPRGLNVASEPKAHRTISKPPLESLRPPLLPLLRHLELIWTTLPHDIGAPFVLSRISTFELHPLFLFLANFLPNLTILTTTLRFSSAHWAASTIATAPNPAPFPKSQWYNIELASYGLALLLCSAKPAPPSKETQQPHQINRRSPNLRTFQIRYQPRNPFASLSPPHPLPTLTPSTIPSLPLVASALLGTQQWGFRADASNLVIAVSHIPWDPMTDTHMVGDEALLSFRVRDGFEGVGVPQGGMDVLGRRPGWWKGMEVGAPAREVELSWGEWADREGDQAYGQLLRRVYAAEWDPLEEEGGEEWWEELMEEEEQG